MGASRGGDVMRPWRELVAGMRRLRRQHEVDGDTDDEVRSYLREAEAELIGRGVPAGQARRQVRLRYGDGLAIREDVARYGWETPILSLWTDLRLAARRLSRSPGFTAVAVLTVGLGIGAATAIVSVVRPVLFDVLPYPDSGQLLAIADRSPDGAPLQVTYGTYLEVVRRGEVLHSVAVSKPWQPTLTGTGEPERLEGQQVSARYFDVLGVVPVLGGGLDPAADVPGGADQVVLSDALWRRRFSADPAVIGSTARLDGRAFTVVGVMGEAFDDVQAASAAVWTLLQYDASQSRFDSREWGHHLDMVARMQRGVDVDEARTQMEAIAANPLPELPRPDWASLEQGWSVLPLRAAVAADARPTALVLLGAAGLLLLIACVNLSLLLLARGTRRRGELGMRLALGAGRMRLVSYLVTENLLVVGLGAATGFVVAQGGIASLVAASPPALSRLAATGVDVEAFVGAVLAAASVATAFGLGPVFARGDRQTQSAREGASRIAGRRSARASQWLVASEVAVAVVLLIGAGLIMRSTQRLYSIAPGFEPDGSIVMRVHGTGLESGDQATHRFFDDALAAVRDVPGVTSVALTSQLPLSGDSDMYGLTRDDPNRAADVDGAAWRYAVTPDYLETMGIDLRRGRGLEAQDLADAPPVAVVSESLARRLFPDGDILGARFHFGAARDLPFTVVGVVGDVKQASLASAQADAVYVPAHQWHWADRVRWLVVRTDRTPEDVVAAVREAVWSADRNQPIVQVQTMTELVAYSEARRRFVLIVLLAFSVSALGLAGIGLFGVLSGSVAQRVREIGVRGALGASSGDIVGLVVRRGLITTALGVVAGLAIAAFATQTLASLLYGVSRLDVITYVGVVLLLAGVAAASSCVPALRAARVDPIAALRAE